MRATSLSPELDLARSLDERLVAARKVQRGAEHRLAILLAELADTGRFRLLGYASIEQYAMVALELTSRVARDLLRIGRSTPELPRLNAALAAGEVNWTKAREVVRVATAETDDSWTERAKTMSARVIEREVAAARMGDPAPTGHPDPELRPARARSFFEMEAACDAETIDMQPGPAEGHATRAIPSVLRRKVLHRAKWKCEVPCCQNRLWLDVHHTEPSAECRTHEPAKLLVVCGAHHRAIHNGYLSVSVRLDGCVAVEHADGRKSVGPARVLRPRTATAVRT